MLTRRGFLGALVAVVAMPRALFTRQPLTTLGLSYVEVSDIVPWKFTVTPELMGDFTGTYTGGPDAVHWFDK